MLHTFEHLRASRQAVLDMDLWPPEMRQYMSASGKEDKYSNQLSQTTNVKFIAVRLT